MPRSLILACALALLIAPTAIWAQSTFPIPGGDEKKDGEGAPRGDGPDDPATPDDDAKAALQAQKGWLGVSLELTTLEEAEALGLGYKQPLIRVKMVFEGSPAHSSGFLHNDLIVAFQDQEVFVIADLVNLVKGTAPGTKVKFTRVRDSKKEEVPLLLGVRPDSYQMLKDLFLDKPAPVISGLNHSTGKDLAAAKMMEGKVVLLDFWATWCGPCKAAIPHIQDMHGKYADQGLVVIGLTDEDAVTVSAFLAATPIPYTIARDEEGETNRKFFVNALPTLFVIDRKGVVRAVFIGARDFDEVEKAIVELLGS